jgi:hypothetical protein
VAPIIPALSNVFRTFVETVELIVPAYLIPCGIVTSFTAYSLIASASTASCSRSFAAVAALAILAATARPDP